MPIDLTLSLVPPAHWADKPGSAQVAGLYQKVIHWLLAFPAKMEILHIAHEYLRYSDRNGDVRMRSLDCRSHL